MNLFNETQPPQAWLDANMHLLLTSDSIANTPELVTTSTGVVTLENSDDATQESQNIGYCLATPNNLSKRTDNTAATVIVRFGQWSERADRPLDIDRSRAIAAETGNIVIAVDTPGQSHNSPTLTSKQKKSMKDGNFNPVTKAQWNTVERVLRDQDIKLRDTEFILVGSSQGATLVASALQTAPEDAVVSTGVLWNSPSFTTKKERGAASLAANFILKGGKKNSEYLAMNPEWAAGDPLPELITRVGARPGGHIAAFKGMARAQDHIKLPNALKEEQHRRMASVLISIVHGTHDTISPLKYNLRAEVLFKAGGFVNVQRVELAEEHHAFTNCIPGLAKVVKDLISG